MASAYVSMHKRPTAILNNQSDIFLDIETHFTQNSETKTKKYYIKYCPNHPDGTRHVGTAIIIRNTN